MKLFRIVGWIGVLTVVSLLYLTSCDLSNNMEDEDVVDELTFIPMSPPNEMAKQVGPPPSPYGCVLSTLNPEGSEHLYRYQGFFLKFPGEVHRQARGKVKNVQFVLANEQIKETELAANEYGSIVRVVNCVIPDSEQAIERLNEELVKFEQESWLQRLKSVDSAQNKMINNQASSTSDGEYVYSCEKIATSIEYTYLNGELIDIKINWRMDCYWLWAPAIDDPFVGGGDIGGGDHSDPTCDNPMDLCFDGGGGGDTSPPNCASGYEWDDVENVCILVDECLTDDPPSYCDEECDTGNPFVDNTEAQDVFKLLWQLSRYDKPEHERLEQAAFMWINPDGSIGWKAVQGEGYIIQTNCDLNVYVPSDLPPNSVFVHTHPYKNGEIQNHCGDRQRQYFSDFINDIDRMMLEHDNISSGIFIDKDNVTMYTEDKSEDNTVKRCF